MKFKKRIDFIRQKKDFLPLTPHQAVILCGYLCRITPHYIRLRPEWDDSASTDVYLNTCREDVNYNDPLAVFARSIVGKTYRAVRAQNSRKSRIRDKTSDSIYTSNILFCKIIKWILANKVRIKFMKTCKKTAETQLYL